MLEQIKNLQIFNEATPEPADWEVLKKAKAALEYFLCSAALYQVHSLIEMVDMCRSSDNISSFTNDIVSLTSRKFLSLKYLENHKTPRGNWEERLALKYRGLTTAAQMIQEKKKVMQGNTEQQRKFMNMLLEISMRWKIVQQGNNLFAVIGKNLQGEDYKVMLLKDNEMGVRLELSPDFKKMKIMNVIVNCAEIELLDVKLPRNTDFPELERASQLIIDADVFKEVHEKISESKEYSVNTFNKEKIEFSVNVISS